MSHIEVNYATRSCTYIWLLLHCRCIPVAAFFSILLLLTPTESYTTGEVHKLANCTLQTNHSNRTYLCYAIASLSEHSIIYTDPTETKLCNEVISVTSTSQNAEANTTTSNKIIIKVSSMHMHTIDV